MRNRNPKTCNRCAAFIESQWIQVGPKRGYWASVCRLRYQQNRGVPAGPCPKPKNYSEYIDCDNEIIEAKQRKEVADA